MAGDCKKNTSNKTPNRLIAKVKEAGLASATNAENAAMTTCEPLRLNAVIREQSTGAARMLALVTGTILSIGLHGLVLGTFLYLVETKPGAIETPTEAISLETTRSEVLEAISASQSAAAQSAQSVAETAGEIKDVSMEQPVELKATQLEHPSHDVAPPIAKAADAAADPEALEVVRGAMDSDRSIAVEVKATEVKIDERNEQNFDPKQPAERAVKAPPKPSARRTHRDKPSELKNKGAASVRSNAGQQKAGRISASSGSSLNYAALVRARVASRRPGGGGGRGTVVVAFSVSRSGALSSARVARSSGNSSLDSSVLAAVRGAGPFPPPPPGANLNFAMPFYFK